MASVVRTAFVIVLCFVGCARRGDRPETAHVHGKVIYKGKSVSSATVTFIGKSPRFAIGTTDDAGIFQLSTFEPNDGAVLGSNSVTLSKAAVPTEAIGVDPKAGRDAYLAAMDRAAEKAIKAQAAGSLLPAKYADAKTTDIHLDVIRGENDFTIELHD